MDEMLPPQFSSLKSGEYEQKAEKSEKRKGWLATAGVGKELQFAHASPARNDAATGEARILPSSLDRALISPTPSQKKKKHFPKQEDICLMDRQELKRNLSLQR